MLVGKWGLDGPRACTEGAHGRRVEKSDAQDAFVGLPGALSNSFHDDLAAMMHRRDARSPVGILDRFVAVEEVLKSQIRGGNCLVAAGPVAGCCRWCVAFR